MPKEVIGYGGIAEALTDVDRDFLFFASGVSNSREVREEEFARERELLLAQPTNRHIVYFSSLCIFFEPDTPYSHHKVNMEELVKANFECYTIVRLGNPEFATNPNQLVPFIKAKLATGEEFPVYDEYRHIVDKEDFLYWMNLIPENRSIETSITGRRMLIKDIVQEIQEGKI